MSVLTEQFLQTLAAGLLVGCLYGLLCVGLAFIFGIMRVFQVFHTNTKYKVCVSFKEQTEGISIAIRHICSNQLLI